MVRQAGFEDDGREGSHIAGGTRRRDSGNRRGKAAEIAGPMIAGGDGGSVLAYIAALRRAKTQRVRVSSEIDKRRGGGERQRQPEHQRIGDQYRECPEATRVLARGGGHALV